MAVLVRAWLGAHDQGDLDMGVSAMYRSIVVGTDCTDTAGVAVEHAAALAHALGAELHVVSVYREPATMAMAQSTCWSAPSEAWSMSAFDDRRRQVEAITHQLRQRGIEVTAHVCRGEPATGLVTMAEECDADLIVVGSRGMNGLRRFLGSVPNAVAHSKEFNVLVVRTD
jgi:nucleotide-binding universal stress UspA family protein